jgi:hypothetical protein
MGYSGLGYGPGRGRGHGDAARQLVAMTTRREGSLAVVVMGTLVSGLVLYLKAKREGETIHRMLLPEL